MLSVEEINKHVGNEIRCLREDAEYTLKEMSYEMGIKHSRIGSWERGEKTIPLYQLQAVGSFFGVAAFELLPLEMREVSE